MSKRWHHHNPAAHPRSQPMSARRKAPSLSHHPDPSASPNSSFSSVPRQQRVLNRGKQTAAPLSSKRETDKSGAFSCKNAHSACRFGFGFLRFEDIACMLLTQTKDAKIMCVIRCQITRTRIHTSLKRLVSTRLNNGRKSFLPVECTLQTKQSLKMKKRMTYFPCAPLYCGRAGRDVIGCRQPTCGVFVCMLQTR